MKCKYCEIEIPDSYVDETCNSCWELKNKVESNYKLETKKKILNELGWLHKDDPVKGLKVVKTKGTLKNKYCDGCHKHGKTVTAVIDETRNMEKYLCDDCLSHPLTIGEALEIPEKVLGECDNCRRNCEHDGIEPVCGGCSLLQNVLTTKDGGIIA